MNKVVSALMIILVIIVLGFGIKAAYDYYERDKEVEEVEKEETKSIISDKERMPEEEKDVIISSVVEEKKEEKPRVEEQKEEKKENPIKKEVLLDKTSRKGKYWVMLDFMFREKEDSYEVTGTVFDAGLYADWVDEIGSAGLPEGEEATDRNGLKGKNLTFMVPKTLKVEADVTEGFEIEEKSLEEFLNGHFGTFLFENEDNTITKMLDWYMNYAG